MAHATVKERTDKHHRDDLCVSRTVSVRYMIRPLLSSDIKLSTYLLQVVLCYQQRAKTPRPVSISAFRKGYAMAILLPGTKTPRTHRIAELSPTSCLSRWIYRQSPGCVVGWVDPTFGGGVIKDWFLRAVTFVSLFSDLFRFAWSHVQNSECLECMKCTRQLCCCSVWGQPNILRK